MYDKTLARYSQVLTRIASLSLIAVACLVSAGCTRTFDKNIVPPPVRGTEEINYDRLQQLLVNDKVQMEQTEDYRLGPGDMISIQIVGYTGQVFGNTLNEAGAEYLLTDSPTLSLPLIGSIQVHGKTQGEFQDELRTAYSQFIKDPRPVVAIKKFNRNQVAVLGSVTKPGKHPMEFGDTVIDVIYKAGGLSMGGRTGGMAPGDFLKVYREKLSQSERSSLTLDEIVEMIREGDQIIPREEIVIPLREFFLKGTMQYNIPVRAGDIIYIPPGGTVNVQGRVNRQGVAFLGPSIATVSEVIVEQGDLRFGAASVVEVVRPQPDGETVSYFVNVRDIKSRKIRDFAVQDGDKIYVYTHPIRAAGEFVGKIFSAGIKTGLDATYKPASGGI